MSNTDPTYFQADGLEAERELEKILVDLTSRFECDGDHLAPAIREAIKDGRITYSDFTPGSQIEHAIARARQAGVFMPDKNPEWQPPPIFGSAPGPVRPQ